MLSAQEHKKNVNQVWKVTLLLSIVTIVEVVLGIQLNSMGAPKAITNTLMIVFSLVKAYAIVSIFMHLGHEKLTMRLTVLGPLMFFIWFIIAFLMEGSAWYDARELRNAAGF